MSQKSDYHIPVLLHETIEGLDIQQDGIYIDATFGGGGHSRVILDKLGDSGKLYGFDQDQDAYQNRLDDSRFEFVPVNFSHMQNFMRRFKVEGVSGILADLGVSSHQFDEGERGFSIRFEGELDMRMNQQSALKASDILKEYELEKMATVFQKYGELKSGYRIAQLIVQSRKLVPLNTTFDLMNLLEQMAPKQRSNKFYAQVFQALRIEVNGELDVLEQLLLQGAKLLKPGGRFVVMSYHSLEDRMVKNFFKRGSISGEITKDFYGNILKPFDEITKKPIVPDEKELEKNSRSRSVKLRIAQKR